MAGNETVAALIGAGIGAGGAVLAQITSSIFSGRRDTQRLEWERTKQEHEETLRREERFLDLKRELYSSYLAVTGEFTMSLLIRSTRGNPAVPPLELETLGSVTSNIELVAPDEVAAWVNLSTIALKRAAAAALIDRSEAENARAEAGGYLVTTRKVMQADLRGSQPSKSALAQPTSPDK